jgi:peptidyl-prolyl cis-trans isomerase D
MLELMRKHAKNWGMKFLLGIIIVVFVFYFGSLRESGNTKTIATIDGKSLSYSDYQQEYQNLTDIYRNRYGAELTEDALRKLGLKKQALDNTINRAVILAEAAELGICASDEEIKNSILSYPAFQRNGVFNQYIYERTLRLNKLTAENFEADQKKLLISAKLQDFISSGVYVSEYEAFDLYRLRKEKINIAFLKLLSKDFQKKVKPTYQALEAYFKEKGEEFRIPDQIQVRFLSFLAADFSSSVKVTESDITEYYERNREKLAKSGKQPPPLAEVIEMITAQLKHASGMRLAAEEAKKSHDVIYQQENFDAYAVGKGFKVHISPFFTANRIPREFAALPDLSNIAFSLQKNEISKVLSDENGYYLFQINAKKSSYIPDITEAGKEIENRYVEKEARLLCQKEAQSTLERLKKGEELEKIAREKGLKVETTGLFPPDAGIPSLGIYGKSTDSLLQLSDNRPYPDKALEINGGYVIARFKERSKLDEDDFLSQKEDLKRIYKEFKKSETISAWLERAKNSLLKEGRLKIVKDIKEL